MRPLKPQYKLQSKAHTAPTPSAFYSSVTTHCLEAALNPNIRHALFLTKTGCLAGPAALGAQPCRHFLLLLFDAFLSFKDHPLQRRC